MQRTRKGADYMQTVTKWLEFDAGHRLQRHESKCRNVHGHRYRVGIMCVAKQLDDVGRVVDFSVIKEKVGGWIDEYWDHGFIVEAGDPFVEALYAAKTKTFQLPDSPTAENMARFLYGIANQLLRPHSVEVVKIEMYETPTSVATYSAQDE